MGNLLALTADEQVEEQSPGSAEGEARMGLGLGIGNADCAAEVGDGREPGCDELLAKRRGVLLALHRVGGEARRTAGRSAASPRRSLPSTSPLP